MESAMASRWVESCRARVFAETAARKKKQEANRNHELEACLIAYHAHRVDGGQMKWDAFRREWYMTRATNNVG